MGGLYDLLRILSIPNFRSMAPMAFCHSIINRCSRKAQFFDSLPFGGAFVFETEWFLPNQYSTTSRDSERLNVFEALACDEWANFLFGVFLLFSEHANDAAEK